MTATTATIPATISISLYDAPALTQTTPEAWSGDWPVFVLSMMKHRRLGQKAGRGWSPARLRPGTTRANENVIDVSGYVGDFDHRSLEDLSRIKDHLAGIGVAYVLHSTYSNDMPDALAFRIIVPFARPVPAFEWPMIWPRVSAYLFLGMNDDTKDVSRFYYLPAAPPDTLVFAEATEGGALDVASVPGGQSNGHTQSGLRLTYLAPAAPIGVEISKGERNNLLTSMAGTMRRRGASEAAILAALVVENDEKCSPPLPEADVRRIAQSVARYAPAEAPDEKGPSGEKTAKPTDGELARRWIATAPRTAYGLGEWRRYEDGIWPSHGDLGIEQEIAPVIEAAVPEGIRITKSLLQSVYHLAKVELAVSDRLWNANEDILVCRNGTLNLESGALQGHNPLDYVTAGVLYAYDPTAQAPTWHNFLSRLIPGVVDFLQEFAGLALTTTTAFEIALWLHGPPGGGKSTFIAGLQAMLGPLAGTIGLADLEKSRFSLARLPGKTLIVATEQPSSFLEASDILNSIISGEPIMIERKYKDPFEVIPHAKICWAMNELPRVPSASNGLFRRVSVVDIPAIPLEQRDPAVKELIREEGAGILNWARAGLERLTARGAFVFPDAVTQATSQFAATNDVPAIFIEDVCEKARAYRVSSNVLYRAYHTWCEENGHKPSSSTRVAEDWRRLGFESKRTNAGIFWDGVRLRAAP